MKLLFLRLYVPVVFFAAVGLVFLYQQRVERQRKTEREIQDLVGWLEENKDWEAAQIKPMEELRRQIEQFDEKPFEAEIAKLDRRLAKFNGTPAERQELLEQRSRRMRAVERILEEKEPMRVSLEAMEQALRERVAKREEIEELLASPRYALSFSIFTNCLRSGVLSCQVRPLTRWPSMATGLST